MQRLLGHRFLIAGVAALAAASAGGAYAATQSERNPRQAFLNDVAKRLKVSPSQLRSALTGAFFDRLQAAVNAGQLTQAQANRIKQRIERNGGVPLGPFAGGAWGHGRLGFGAPGFGPPAFGAPGFGALGPPGPGHNALIAAARYLGLSETQLITDLRRGTTLAQVARGQGKSVSGLEDVLVSDARSRLDRLVSAGLITRHQEQLGLGRLRAGIDRLVNRGQIEIFRWKGGPPPRMFRRGGGAPGMFGNAVPPPGIPGAATGRPAALPAPLAGPGPATSPSAGPGFGPPPAA